MDSLFFIEKHEWIIFGFEQITVDIPKSLWDVFSAPPGNKKPFSDLNVLS